MSTPQAIVTAAEKTSIDAVHAALASLFPDTMVMNVLDTSDPDVVYSGVTAMFDGGIFLTVNVNIVVSR